MLLKRLKGRIALGWVFLILTVGSYVAAREQIKVQDLFASVPATLRSGLDERLNLLIQYQRTQQWEKAYDLLSTTFTQGDSKEVYVARNRRHYSEVAPDDIIVNFVPKATTVHELSEDGSSLTIYGCASLNKKGNQIELSASVDAYREDGQWYFSEVGVITAIDGGAQPCPYSVKNSQYSRCSTPMVKVTKVSRQH